MSSSWKGTGRRAAPWLVAAMAAGCGGGGGGGGNPAASTSGWVAGTFLPAASFAGRCVNPRAGNDPQGQPYNEVAGTAADENNWLRSYSNHLYLWYNEIVDRDPGLYATPQYFDLLKTTAITASGNSKDRFHFTYCTTDWLALQQSGTEAGYGAVWSVIASAPPRRVVVAYTHPSSPATAPQANLQRGEEVLFIDGVDVRNAPSQADVNVIVAGLYPDQLNETHTFRVRTLQGGERTVTMQSANVTLDPVQNVGTIATQAGAVGYIHFTDHLLSAEQQLIDAFATLAAQNVSDLVLDLRYNGGGLLAIASEVAYMVAGEVPTAGQPFERLVFNDKHTAANPVTGGALTPMPFFNGSSTGQRLPTLNLSRVYVLTGGTTCSASESIINGLRGVSVQVIQIGSTTCGKPYGFYPADHCGTTYFSVQFKGVNAANFGDYTDGFAPNNRASAGGERLPGCSVSDDFSASLGNPLEARLAAALDHRLGRSCPAPSGAKPSSTKPISGALTDADGDVQKAPWLMNRILEGA